MGRIAERKQPRVAVTALTVTRAFWRPAEPRVWLDLGDASVGLVQSRLGATEAEVHEAKAYDTPDLDLRTGGVSLTVARAGTRAVQRVWGRATAAATEVLVHETEADDGPDLGHAAAVMPPAVAERVRETGVAALFSVRFTRVRGHFPADIPILDVVLDRGVVIVGDKEMPFAELAVANHANLVGAPALAGLLSDVPVRLAAEDRWDRGYRLATGAGPRPYHARVPPVAATARLGDAAAQVLRQAFAHFIRNLPAASVRGEAEAVHQMRVGMRRLNACIGIFPRLLDAGLVADIAALRRLFESLAEVRECDVFLDATLPRIAAAALPAADRSALEVSVRLHRASALGALRRTFDGPDLALLVTALDLRLSGWRWRKRIGPLDELGPSLGTTEFSARRIRALHRRLLRSEPADVRDVPAWHQARKRAKRLRYATEPLLAAYPGKRAAVRRYARRLAKLQDVLGDLNDLRTAGDLITRLVDMGDAGISARTQESVRAHVAERLRAHLPRVARALHRAGEAFPKVRAAARRPFVVAVLGDPDGYAAPMAAQLSAAWSVSGLRTAVVAGRGFGRLSAWISRRSEDWPRIAQRAGIGHAWGDAQRVVWAVKPPSDAQGWRRLRAVADAIVVPVSAGNIMEAQAVLTKLRRRRAPVLPVAVAAGRAAPAFDATAVLRWTAQYRALARSGRSIFDEADGAAAEAQAEWLSLFEAIERLVHTDCTSSELLRQVGSGFSGEVASSWVDI